jgi:hypothetical protein
MVPIPKCKRKTLLTLLQHDTAGRCNKICDRLRETRTVKFSFNHISLCTDLSHEAC